jgi:PAS domain S-box-containing protein
LPALTLLAVSPAGADHLLAAMMSTRQLETILGSCTVLHAHSAQEALARLDEAAIDACVVDAGLGSALEFIRAARSRAFRKAIVLVAGDAGRDVREAALAAGATEAVARAGISPIVLGQAIQGAILRTRFEESIARVEAQFQRAFRENPIGNTITSMATGRFVDVNEAFCRMVGYRREELVGRSSVELDLFQDPADRPRLVELLRHDGGYRDVELRLKDRDGRPLTALVSAQVMDIGGQACILAAMVDVTAHRAVADELRRRELHLSEAEELAGLGSWEWSPATGELAWSRNLRRMVGLSSTETGGLGAYLARVHPDDRDAVAAAFDRLRHDDGPLEHEHRLRRDDGKVLRVRARVRALGGSDGTRRLLGIVQELAAPPAETVRVARSSP